MILNHHLTLFHDLVTMVTCARETFPTHDGDETRGPPRRHGATSQIRLAAARAAPAANAVHTAHAALRSAFHQRGGKIFQRGKKTVAVLLRPRSYPEAWPPSYVPSFFSSLCTSFLPSRSALVRRRRRERRPERV